MSSTTTARDYTTALICVRVGRDTIDPAGLGSDEEVEAAEEFILDAVREEFPGADVRSVGDGGRTDGCLSDGTDITREVRACVQDAWQRWLDQL